MMEEASTSESSVNFYQTTRRNNPEDSHLHTRRRENLKSHLVHFLLCIVVLLLFPNSVLGFESMVCLLCVQQRYAAIL
jgi:hypothetical protein